MHTHGGSQLLSPISSSSQRQQQQQQPRRGTTTFVSSTTMNMLGLRWSVHRGSGFVEDDYSRRYRRRRDRPSHHYGPRGRSAIPADDEDAQPRRTFDRGLVDDNYRLGDATVGATVHPATADRGANPPSPRTMTTRGQGDRSPSPPPPPRPSSFRRRGGGNNTTLMLPDFGEMMARGPSEVYRCPSSSMYNVPSCSQSVISEISERTGAFSLGGPVPLPDFTSGGATKEGGRNFTSNDNDLLAACQTPGPHRDPTYPRRPCRPHRGGRACLSLPTNSAMAIFTITTTRPSRRYRVSIRSSTTYDPTTPPSSRCGRGQAEEGTAKR